MQERKNGRDDASVGEITREKSFYIYITTNGTFRYALYASEVYNSVTRLPMHFRHGIEKVIPQDAGLYTAPRGSFVYIELRMIFETEKIYI